MDSDASSPIVRLNIGGNEFCTTVDTLTIKEPQSMLAAMFSGRHTVHEDLEKGYVFVDRDGMHFRHILNWLRDGEAPNLSDSEYLEVLQEAKYYQILGLVDKINEVLNKKEDAQMHTDLTRTDIIKCVQSYNYIKFRGVNLSGLNLSKLDLSNLDLSCVFIGANLRGALMAGVNLTGAMLQGAWLIDCSLVGADLRYANLESAYLTNVNLEGANLEGANLKGANLKGANLSNANLHNTHLEETTF